MRAAPSSATNRDSAEAMYSAVRTKGRVKEMIDPVQYYLHDIYLSAQIMSCTLQWEQRHCQRDDVALSYLPTCHLFGYADHSLDEMHSVVRTKSTAKEMMRPFQNYRHVISSVTQITH